MDSTYIHASGSTLPSQIFKVQDPARHWPGAAPNFGMEVVPQVMTVAGITGLAGHAYLNADEALRHSIENAERMRADCQIMECLEARQRATALLNWHLEPEDPKSLDQKNLATEMTKIVQRTPYFMEWRHCLSQAVWYGRYGVANQFGSKEIAGKMRTVCTRWEPRNGDKLVFRYDDGDARYEAGQVGIRIGTLGLTKRRLIREQIEYTQSGTVYWLNDYERRLLAVHKHTREDGTYEDVYSSARIHGVGIRSRIYWTWYAMVECLQRALEYLDRSAFGVEIWRYPANNVKAKSQVEDAAKRLVSGGRTILLVPSWPADQGADQYGVDHVEPGLQGVDRLLEVIKTYFGHKIKRYILGQTLTSEADATGMGSGVADAHLATFSDIVQYDARNLEESITEEYLRHLQCWNFPQSRGIYLRFVIDTEAPNIKEKLDAYKACWDMGIKLKDSDIADAAGFSLPGPNDSVVFNAQVRAGIDQAMGGMQFIGAPCGPIKPAGPQELTQLLSGVMSKNLSPQTMPEMIGHVQQHLADNEELGI